MAVAADEEERERQFSALFAVDTEEAEVAREADPSVPSSLQLEYEEDGVTPKLTRFTYVDEVTCIGCKNCAFVARSTFFMEDDHGRARVFNQGGDVGDVIDEAIDSCPVNCIHYVSLEDLVILEQEREGQVINAYVPNRFEGTMANQAAPSKARALDYGGIRCTNCPSRGCRDCPMYGVGNNPVYLHRQEEREAKRSQTGEARRERTERQRSAMIDELFDTAAAVDAAPADEEASEDGVLPLPEREDQVDIFATIFNVPSLDEADESGEED